MTLGHSTHVSATVGMHNDDSALFVYCALVVESLPQKNFNLS